MRYLSQYKGLRALAKCAPMSPILIKMGDVVKLSNRISAFILSWLCCTHVIAVDPAKDIKVSTILKTNSSWDGEPIHYPAGKPQVTGMVIEFAPGAETGWHMHPANSFGMLLEGDFEIRLKNGDIKRLKAGDALAEVANKLHNGKNVGTTTAKIIVFYMGEENQTLTIKEGKNNQ